MSESFEREVIHKRIAGLEEQIRAEHLRWDALFEDGPFRSYRAEIQGIVDSIRSMQDEILILKRVISAADYAAEVAAGS